MIENTFFFFFFEGFVEFHGKIYSFPILFSVTFVIPGTKREFWVYRVYPAWKRMVPQKKKKKKIIARAVRNSYHDMTL